MHAHTRHCDLGRKHGRRVSFGRSGKVAAAEPGPRQRAAGQSPRSLHDFHSQNCSVSMRPRRTKSGKFFTPFDIKPSPVPGKLPRTPGDFPGPAVPAPADGVPRIAAVSPFTQETWKSLLRKPKPSGASIAPFRLARPPRPG